MRLFCPFKRNSLQSKERNLLYLKKLGLLSFRNYQRLLFVPDRNVNIITGANAQGKTNLLEAILLVISGHSHRTLQDDHLIKWSFPFAAIKSEINFMGRDIIVEMRIDNNAKVIRLNGNTINRDQLPGNQAVVLFNPKDFDLIHGSPQERRRFLNQEVASFFRPYNDYLLKYKHILWQKNNALRLVREGRQSAGSLSIWDDQLILYGSKILYFRNQWLESFKVALRHYYAIISGEKTCEVGLSYSFTGASAKTEAEISENFRQALSETQNMALSQLYTPVGPHRDDLIFSVNEKEAKFYFSQGQKSTLALCLRLAGYELRKEKLGEEPLILFDDAFYALDSRRTERFLKIIPTETQTFITSSSPVGKGKIFRVVNGNVEEADTLNKPHLKGV